MQELLNNYINITNKEVWKTVSTGWNIALIVVAVIIFSITILGTLGLKHKIILALVEATVFTACATGLCMIVVLETSKADLMKEKAIEIAKFAIDNNIELQVTDDYFIYDNKTYKHNIDYIDNYIITDKNGKLIIVEQ